MSSGSTNAQIVDSVATTDALVAGMAAPLAMGLTYSSMADSLGIAMHNAVSTQYGMQTTARAATAVTCAEIVAAGAASLAGS